MSEGWKLAICIGVGLLAVAGYAWQTDARFSWDKLFTLLVVTGGVWLVFGNERK